MVKRNIRGVTKQNANEFGFYKGRVMDGLPPLSGGEYAFDDAMNAHDARKATERISMLGSLIVTTMRRLANERIRNEQFEEPNITASKIALDNTIRLLYPVNYNELRGNNWETVVSRLFVHLKMRRPRDEEYMTIDVLIEEILTRIEEILNTHGGYSRSL
jgi:hypothetical protein